MAIEWWRALQVNSHRRLTLMCSKSHTIHHNEMPPRGVDAHRLSIQNGDMQFHSLSKFWESDKLRCPCHFRSLWSNFPVQLVCEWWIFSAVLCTAIWPDFHNFSLLNKKSSMIYRVWLHWPSRRYGPDHASRPPRGTKKIIKRSNNDYEIMWANVFWESAYIEWNRSVVDECIFNIACAFFDFDYVWTTFYVLTQFHWAKVFLINIRIQKLCQFWQISNCCWHSHNLNVGWIIK